MTRTFARELAGARVTWTSPFLFRETRPFLNRARTVCLFKFPTRTRETFASPFLLARPLRPFSFASFARPTSAVHQPIFHGARSGVDAGGWVGGCSTLGIARRLPAMSRQVDVTARVRGANVPFKIRMLQHVTSTSWPSYSAFVFAGRP